MRLLHLWVLGALAGLAGALLVFDARPGLNWLIWTCIAVIGFIVYRRPEKEMLRTLAVPLGFAVVLAAGAVVTTTPPLLFAIGVIVASLLALSILLASDPVSPGDYGAVAILSAPFRGLARTARGIFTGASDTMESLGAARMSPVLRGSLIAAPVVIVLALLFATADPLLARGRDAIYDTLADWTDIPRIVFGILLTLFVIGAYVASSMTTPHVARAGVPGMWLDRIGLTERRVVLYAAAAMSWLFVVLQISYLFGTIPSVAGSGITFAEYAHRGFAELTVAATGVSLLIVAVHRTLPSTGARELKRGIAPPSLVLLAAVGCILFSAFHRLTVYEDAYGYTPARVYAQVYIGLTLLILVLLAWQVTQSFDVRSLARHVMMASLCALTALVFWNGDAWVARANIDRYAQTGKLDTEFLARELSPDAYPALVASLPKIAEPERAQLVRALAHEYSRSSELKTEPNWFEWNLRRGMARGAVSPLALSLNKTAPAQLVIPTQK
jgi:hypothetical protein